MFDAINMDYRQRNPKWINYFYFPVWDTKDQTLMSQMGQLDFWL